MTQTVGYNRYNGYNRRMNGSHVPSSVSSEPVFSSRYLLLLVPLLVAADTLLAGVALGVAAAVLAVLMPLARRVPGLRAATPAGIATRLLIVSGAVALLQILFSALSFGLQLALGTSLALALTLAMASVLPDSEGNALISARGRLVPLILLPLLLLPLVGVVREALGRGTLLGDALGMDAGGRAFTGVALLAAPAGALLLLGLCLAAWNTWHGRGGGDS